MKATLPTCICIAALAACGKSSSPLHNPSEARDDAMPRSLGDASPAANLPNSITNFGASGPFSVVVSSGSIALDDCKLLYSLYTPSTAAPAPLVVLGHGFSRGQAQMAGMAQHLAGFGVRVATPQYCHLSAFDTDHMQNGRDAAALSSALASGAPVIHAGQSAGALAAVLGGGQDKNAIAVLGLDLVDAGNLAATTAASLSIPLFGMAAEAGQCNANNNGASAYQGDEKWVVRVNGATHCDFEDPTNALCRAFCDGDGGGLPTIRALAAAFVSWQFKIDASGKEWSSPTGSQWQRLVSEGVLSPL